MSHYSAFPGEHDEIVGFKKLRVYVAQQAAQQNIALILLVFWGLFIVYGTMLPFDFSASRRPDSGAVTAVMGTSSCRGLGGSWADVYSNIAFFMPWGFLLADLAGEPRVRGWWRTLVLALVSGACLSGSVEIVQLFAPKRSPSVVDLVTNTFGSVVGSFDRLAAGAVDLAGRVGPDSASFC